MHDRNDLADPTWTSEVPRSKAHLINRTIRNTITEAIQPALYGDYWEYPRIISGFGERFVAGIGFDHAAVIHSGASALFFALKAGGFTFGDEVITLANSDMSTTSAIVNCGASPVLCDILSLDIPSILIKASL